jgi:hypothetical protein
MTTLYVQLNLKVLFLCLHHYHHSLIANNDGNPKHGNLLSSFILSLIEASELT